MKFNDYVKEHKVNESRSPRLDTRIPNEVGKFWVVDDLSPERFEVDSPSIEDVLFEVGIDDFAMMVAGGLDMGGIEGIFKSKPSAIKFMKKNFPEASGLLF